jgi:ABC-type metal ion transport system substrate-binding protein
MIVNGKLDIADVVVAIKSDASVIIDELEDKDAAIASIRWIDDNPTNITAEQVKAKYTEMQAAYDALEYARTREKAYPELKEFAEAYTEKEIGEDSTKWDAYVTAYNKVRSDTSKP